MKSNPDYTFNDFAILSRKQRDGLNAAQILISEGIPVKYVGKSDLRSSPSAKVLFSFLRISCLHRSLERNLELHFRVSIFFSSDSLASKSSALLQ